MTCLHGVQDISRFRWPTYRSGFSPFFDRLAAEDRLAATRRAGYRYDLLQFSAWYGALHGSLPELPRLIEHDLIA